MNTNQETPLPPSQDQPLTCDLAALPGADLAVVDALARLRLAATRHGVRVELKNASGPLRELLAFSGLAGVLPPVAEDGLPELLGVQPGRKAEEREEHIGVEEVGETGDPAL
ncbi:STAS domain-containing protein [Kitasatospora sp. RG8]|uniref:STAS domain-containing protein n=1 Tax=Kitasatospora sp. RG8 TaxID=2820815 RepID=UPI001ADF228A|nr:STAS domain-containing protein [Kitasatospora sp. RG8]MBP0452170.1 STAS domain-containing protein [Kitasatospora sp. RG8]